MFWVYEEESYITIPKKVQNVRKMREMGVCKEKGFSQTGKQEFRVCGDSFFADTPRLEKIQPERQEKLEV